MKKFFIILLVIIVLIVLGYNFSKKKEFTTETVENNTAVSQETTVTDDSNEEDTSYVDDNPITLGIYSMNSSNTKRVLMKEVTKPWIYHKDIIEYNVFYTQDEEIDATRLAICYDKYAGLYEEDVSKYRIGYNVQFSIDDETINKTIISPKDTEEFYDYLEVYLYDGYHRTPGEWYSHTTEEEFNDETLLLGIKLTAGTKVDKINSDITLTAFSYDLDDFDKNGDYIGNSKYSIIIHKA